MRPFQALLLAVLALLPACASHVTVMTWNIHHGRGLDGKVDLERIARVIRDSGAQLVALQEVDVGTERTARRDLAGELAALCGMRSVFHKTSRPQAWYPRLRCSSAQLT